MTQRTLRIDDEMVERAYDALTLENCFLGNRAIRVALEAALSPYLERRKVERRDIKASSPEPTKAEVPTCGGGVEGKTTVKRIAFKDGYPIVDRREPQSPWIASLWRGFGGRRKGEQSHGYKPDPTPKGIDTASTGTGQEGNKQNTPTEIPVSLGMHSAGIDALKPFEYRLVPKDGVQQSFVGVRLGDFWEAVAAVYRAMESQRRKEQG